MMYDKKAMNIEENVRRLLEEIGGGNCYGEKVFLVAATKTRTPEEIGRAVRAGIAMIGENKVQEFRDKYDAIEGAERHFIGNLQTNKIKYLIGKCDLIHSVGSVRLAAEISRLAQQKSVVQDILLEINLGEENKGGIPFAEAEQAYGEIAPLAGTRIRGLMAMLPEHGDEDFLKSLCRKMRSLFETLRERNADVAFLSMGMSGDYKLCLGQGSNMIRIGTGIFGERNYR